MNQTLQGQKSPCLFARAFFSLYSLPSLGLFFSSSLCCVSLYCEPVIIHLGGVGGGGVTGKRKMEETAVVSLTWLFILLNRTVMCH